MIEELPDRDLMGIEHQLSAGNDRDGEFGQDFPQADCEHGFDNRPKLSHGGTECVCPSYSMK